MHTGDVIKTQRKEKGMTQEELAQHLGVEKSSIQKYESGRVQNLKLETIQKLCQLFEVPPFAFIYPQDWKEFHIENKNNSKDFFVKGEIYFKLNEKGKKKVLEYIDDISQIEEYNNPNKTILQMYKKSTKSK